MSDYPSGIEVSLTLAIIGIVIATVGVVMAIAWLFDRLAGSDEG